MKKIISILTCFLYTLFLSGQTVSVSATKMNLFYNGLPNPFKVVVENQDCNNIVVKATKGEIEGKECEYIYRFVDSTVNSTTTKIYVGINRKKTINWIDSVEYRINKLPDPTPTINWKMISIIREHGLKYYQENSGDENYTLGIINEQLNFDYMLYIPVIQYSIKIIRQDSVIFENKQIFGAKIMKNIVDKYLIAGKAGDMVIVYDIISQAPDGGKRRYDKLEYQLK
ncbi:MAG: hypothetical protein WCH34_03840 [Bacteroidota bacterium]